MLCEEKSCVIAVVQFLTVHMSPTGTQPVAALH